MSTLVERLGAGDMLLCNESFAATNEREGSEVAGEVIRALLDTGKVVVFVTHLYELAHDLHQQRRRDTLFLRADRRDDGQRPFTISEGAPLATSYAEDLYRRTFRPLETVGDQRAGGVRGGDQGRPEAPLGG